MPMPPPGSAPPSPPYKPTKYEDPDAPSQGRGIHFSFWPILFTLVGMFFYPTWSKLPWGVCLVILVALSVTWSWYTWLLHNQAFKAGKRREPINRGLAHKDAWPPLSDKWRRVLKAGIWIITFVVLIVVPFITHNTIH